MITHSGSCRIQTQRLVLRKFMQSDAEPMFNNWAGDCENVKYVSWKAHKSLSETQKIVSDWIQGYSNLDYYRWVITLKDSGHVIGEISVIDFSDCDECCEIGYILSKKYWNMGFMTEALNAVIRYLFEKVGFHRVQLRHDVSNPASGRVMQKNGLKYEGTLRHSRKDNQGNYCDTSIYSILKFEFKF